MEQQDDIPLALVVEDEALLALEMEERLLAEGFVARLACTEGAALAEHPATLSLAVVNMRLNGKLIGREVIVGLRQRQPDLPVVVVTGYQPDAPQADLRGLGWPTIRLQKPIADGALTAAVRSVLEQARTGRRPAGGRRREDRTGRAAD